MHAIFHRPSNLEQALTLNLTLAITAPQNHPDLDWLITTAEEYAASLDLSTVETCKAAAVERAELYFASSGA